MIGLLMAHTLEGVEFLNLGLLLSTIAVADSNVHAVLQCTTVYTTYSDTTCIRTVVE